MLPQWSIGIIQIISIVKTLIVPTSVPHQHSLLSQKVRIRMLKATEKETDGWDIMLSFHLNETAVEGRTSFEPVNSITSIATSTSKKYKMPES